MIFKLHGVGIAAMLAFSGATAAADLPIDIKKDPAGKHFVIEKQGTADMPILITKRVGPDDRAYFIKRSFDCKHWKVRHMGSGPTLEMMNKGEPEAESVASEAGSIPDHYARHACPPPHPGPR